MSFCSRNVSALFNILQLAAILIRASAISKISQLGSIGASLCRMPSLDRKVCKRLALLIALCLLFSLIPVAGSDRELEPKDAKESLNELNTIVLRSIPGRVLAPRISAREIASGANLAGNAFAQVQTIDAGQGKSARKLLQTFSKPDQGVLSVTGLEYMIAIKQTPGAGFSDVNGAANTDRGASLKRALFADAIRLLNYQMERLKKRRPLNCDQRYINVKGFQLIEEIEGETHRRNNQNAVSHGLIRVKPIERIKAVEKELYGPQDHQRRALASAEMAALQQQAGMFSVKLAEANKAAEQGLSKLSHLQFGQGLTGEQEQIHNVVAALRQSGLFAAIAGAIEGMNLFMLPQFTTIFVPTDSAYQSIRQEDINFQLFQYHIVMQRYEFTQLCRLKVGDILYTLLPGYSIIVTAEQSAFKISLDGVSLIAPNLYMDQSIVVHGINGIFNYTMYGKKFGGWHEVPEAGAPLPANVSDKQAPPSLSAPAQGPDPSNASVAGSGETGQQPDPVQQNAGTIPTPTSATGEFSPLGSELASDTDASDDILSAKIGACAAATAFVCVLWILCC